MLTSRATPCDMQVVHFLEELNYGSFIWLIRILSITFIHVINFDPNTSFSIHGHQNVKWQLASSNLTLE